jgi:hypothetical protein
MQNGATRSISLKSTWEKSGKRGENGSNTDPVICEERGVDAMEQMTIATQTETKEFSRPANVLLHSVPLVEQQLHEAIAQSAILRKLTALIADRRYSAMLLRSFPIFRVGDNSNV